MYLSIWNVDSGLGDQGSDSSIDYYFKELSADLWFKKVMGIYGFLLVVYKGRRGHCDSRTGWGCCGGDDMAK